MTFEDFMMAAAEDDEFMEVLMQMANHSDKAKSEEERKELKKLAREECKKGWR